MLRRARALEVTALEPEEPACFVGLASLQLALGRRDAADEAAEQLPHAS